MTFSTCCKSICLRFLNPLESNSKHLSVAFPPCMSSTSQGEVCMYVCMFTGEREKITGKDTHYLKPWAIVHE